MKKLQRSRLLPITGFMLGALVWLANSGNPPTGKTGAPFNGNCNDCHNGNSYNGTLEVTGFPATANPDQVYDITLKITATSGAPVRAGFQLVVVDENNANCGDLINIAGNGTGTENLQTREYMEQRNPKNFAGGTVSWSFQWRAPVNMSGSTIKAYFIGNMCNGTGGTGGDNPVWDNITFGFAGNPPVAAQITNTVNPTCNGVADGSATAEGSGGTPPYTYAWSDGQTTQTAINLTAGTYTVTVTGSNNSGTATASTTLTEPPALNLSTSISGTVTCLTTATVTAIASGGTPGYTIEWSDGQTGETAIFDEIGTYTVSVTDNNGCVRANTVNITGDIAPPLAFASAPVELNCTTPQVQLSGTGSSTGTNFTYQWTTTTGNIVSDATTLTPTINQCGTYVLRVTNTTNGCTATASTSPDCQLTPPVATATGGNITCLAPSLMLTGSSNTPGSNFQWTGPGITPDNQNEQNPVVDQGGSYTLTVTNPENGCKDSDTVTVTASLTPPGVTASVSGPLNCLIDSVILSGTSPTPSVSFAWSGTNFSSSQQNTVTNEPGDYTLVVTDTLNGCASSVTVNVVENVTLPFDSIVPPGNLNCKNDSIQLNATPSSQGPNFTYLWTATEGGHILSGDTSLTPVVDSVGKYFLKITNLDNGCISLDSVVVKQSAPVGANLDTIQHVSCFNGNNGLATISGNGGNGVYFFAWSTGDSTASVSNLIAGNYFASITDGENCSATITVSITQPDMLMANASANGETALGANDGSATASPSGGTPAYSYLWSNGDTTQAISNLTPGPVTVSVTDANGCTTVETVTVNAFGCNLNGTTAATNTSCQGSNDGLASISLTGAANPVTYLWSNGETTQSINNLSPGIYTVSILDGNGCAAVYSVNVAEPLAISPNATTTSVTAIGASDGTATANPTGGTPAYQYLWSTGETTADISGLAPGSYNVIVTDNNGCTAEQTVNVSAFNCILSASMSAVNLTCYEAGNGQATVILVNGTLPFTYQWSNNQTTQTITQLSAGTYTVSATDGAGCSITQSVTVAQPDLLELSIVEIQNVICPDDTDGQVEIAIIGGTPPYSFVWPGGSSGNLGVGDYTLSVTDNNGCSNTVSFSIESTDTIPPAMTCPADIQICGPDFISYGGPSVSDNCGIGSSPIVISGPPSGSIFDDGITVIVYEVTDVSGNKATCSFNITVYPISDILIDQIVNDMNGQNVGAISVTPVGVGPFAYSWTKDGQFFANIEDLSGLGAGTYMLAITDANGCTSALAPIILTNTVSASEPGIAANIRLWPNPASTFVELTILDIDVICLQIVDMRGRLVKEIAMSDIGKPLNIQTLPGGMYNLVVHTSEGKVVSLKFVKE